MFDESVLDSSYEPSSSQNTVATDETVLGPVETKKLQINFDVDVCKDTLILRLLEDRELCKKILDSLPHRVEGWCKLGIKRANVCLQFFFSNVSFFFGRKAVLLIVIQQDGYVRVASHGCKDFVQAHWLALWSVGKYRNGPEDASHLCGNPSCFVPEHLIWESHQLNMNRRACQVWVDQPPCECCGTQSVKKINLCSHADANGHHRCIKYCEGWADHVSFENGGLLL